MTSNDIQGKWKQIAEKSTSDSKKISPLGISRYGRTRKPKISQDFCSIDDVIENNEDDDVKDNNEDDDFFVKESKSPSKTYNRLKSSLINGIQTIKETPVRLKIRSIHNNNSEIMHITGDSDINYSPECKAENLQKSRKFFKTSENTKLPIIKHIYVTKEKIPEIKDKNLTEELKPILSEEIFQNPPIDISEVFKIISNKSHDLELEINTKPNTKGIVKTYTNKRKSFKKPTTLIESFGLPDKPIVPIRNENVAQPLRISEIDVDIVKPESVNLINRELVDSLWKISIPENNYVCHDDNHILVPPIFDVRARFTPTENNIDENIHYSKTAGSNKCIKTYENKSEISTSLANSTSNRSQTGNNILKTCTEENIIPDSSQDLKTYKNLNKQVIKKRISNIKSNVIKSKTNENSIYLNSSNDIIKEEPKPAVKTENSISFDVKSADIFTPKRSICTLVYETKRDNFIKQEENIISDPKETETNIEEGRFRETCDIEDHIKATLITKEATDEIEIDNNSIHMSNNIDINKLKSQISSRIETRKSEEKVLLMNAEVKCDVETVTATDHDTTYMIEKENIKLRSISPSTTTDSVADYTEKFQYELGDVMWAKVGRYPYWPCLITEEPVSKKYNGISKRNTKEYHVRFFADNGRRSWITEKNLLPYDTDLSKIQKELKHEIILPQPKSRSYEYWMMGINEADSVKDKMIDKKLEFFAKMAHSKRLSKEKKRLSEIGGRKRSNTETTTKETYIETRDTRRISRAVSSSKLKEEILEELKDMAKANYSKRMTRSSLVERNVSKSRSPTTRRKIKRKLFGKLRNKRMKNGKISTNYSTEHESLSNSNSSDDEGSSNSSASVTLEYQTALYKRNNLFKGISKERVCQICEKAKGVIKCKGRCNGYYHIACASQPARANVNSSFDNEFVSVQDLQRLTNTNRTNEPDELVKQTKINDTFNNESNIIKDSLERQDLNEEKHGSVEFPKRRTRSSCFNSVLENQEVKSEQREDVIENLGYRRKTRNSEIAKIEIKTNKDISVQNRRATRSNSKEEVMMSTDIKYVTEEIMQNRRLTRSRSQEPEYDRSFIQNRRIARSCSQEPERNKFVSQTRRITRSCSQEPEYDRYFIQNRRIPRSRSQEPEIPSKRMKLSKSLQKHNNKIEKSSSRSTSRRKQTDHVNSFKKDINNKQHSKSRGEVVSEENERTSQKSRKQILEVAGDDQILERNGEEDSNKVFALSEITEPNKNQILRESNKDKNEIDQVTDIVNLNNSDKSMIKTRDSTKGSNVKIINIKSRKRSVNSPTLTLNNDPEFDRLPLHVQIDHKMKELMQKIDRKPFYADSTTDYTSSEESALDLLSPRGKKMKDNIEINVKNELDAHDSNYSNILSESDFFNVKEFKPKSEIHSEADFKCLECSEDIDHACFVCHEEISRSGSNIRQKCSLFPCGKFYHPECLKVWPQTQWSVISSTKHKQSNTDVDTFVCPVHVCHTCVSDDPRAAIPRCTSDKVVKCLRCPATYHNSAYCIPAGTEILSSTQIICPRHLIPIRIIKKALPIINATWCFICSEGGNLICCEMCPTSVHSECLDINLREEDTFICEDCETGRFPLYDEIVWVKLGYYRWWPAVILFPNEVPDNVKSIKHRRGEFVVRFFGTYDHYWIGRGRVFLFQEGDSGEACSSKRKLQKVDVLFEKSIQQASEAHAIKKEFKQTIIEEAAIKLKHKPPPYIKIKVNRPVGNVRQFDGNISNTTPCECDPKKKNPCGADSDCLNRLLLTECNPEVCPAGEKCQNQNFEKRSYPPLVPYRTETRGWGLKSLEPIRKGQFVIEYVGEMIDEQEYQRRIKKMHEQKEENYYFLTIDKDRMLDAGPKGNVSRFMNHSCQPNCETQKWTVNGDTRVGLFAVKDVPANTELTFNYNLECVGKEKKICKCGAPNCSGYIGVKVKQEESHKKLKSKVKHKKKKSFPALVSETTNKEPCFICGDAGDVSPCNNKICTKYYHLKCVNLNIWPDNKWVCPWHNCNICTKRTIRCCVKCVNSYCPVHSEGNVRYDKLLGFICSEHDPNNADSQDIKIENSKNTDTFSLKITEENDVTSTTCDELDHHICEQLKDADQSQEIDQIKECQLTPRKLSDNLEIVTSTPIKFAHDDIVDNTISQHFDVHQQSVNIQVKRKRGRPRKSLGESTRMHKEKRVKLNENPETLVMEEKSKETTQLTNEVAELSSTTVPSRNLRTTKVVNYGGLSEKLIAAQRKIRNQLTNKEESDT